MLSYKIENESVAWMPITRYVKRSLQGHLIRVVHEYGSFVCSPNHKIWTEEHGYVEAGLLQGGASLRMLPDGISREQQRKEHSQVLQQVMCEPDQQQQSSKKRGSSSTYEQASNHKN